ncbi:MAG: metal-dependent hydrolase [Planctomycetaceae bacterium]|nr:metal-dependent hydrolase [Planctomycetaceae bacterium]
MRFMFLGTGRYRPTETRHTACLFQPETGLVFDAGTGLFRVFSNLKTRDLDIFVTHSHLDHIMGLPDCHVPLKLDHLDRVRVFGNQKTLDAIRQHLFAPALFPVQTTLEFHELTTSHEVQGGGILTQISLDHPGGSTGYKVSWPNFSMAYITDTFANDSYREFISGVDLLVHECNFDDELRDLAEQTGHSYASAVAQVAKSANVKHLVLTHFDAYADPHRPIDLERVRSIFPNTTIARDLMTFDHPE